LICGVHALVLILGYFLKGLPQAAGLLIIFVIMLVTVFVFQRLKMPELPSIVNS